MIMNTNMDIYVLGGVVDLRVVIDYNCVRQTTNPLNIHCIFYLLRLLYTVSDHVPLGTDQVMNLIDTYCSSAASDIYNSLHI